MTIQKLTLSRSIQDWTLSRKIQNSYVPGVDGAALGQGGDRGDSGGAGARWQGLHGLKVNWWQY